MTLLHSRIAFFCLLGLSAAVPAQGVPPPPGLVSWWPGEGNGDDIQGPNPASLIGGIGFGPGIVDSAFLLSGGYADAGNDLSLHVSAGDFTIECWVRFNSTGGDMSIIDKMSASGVNGNGWRLIKQSDNRFWFCFGAGGNGCSPGAPTTILSTTTATVGPWYHVAVTKDSSSYRIYVNGVQESVKPTPALVDTNVASVRLGSYVLEGAYLNGLIDEASIYSQALSAADIAAIFQAGSDGKLKNNPPTANAGPDQVVPEGTPAVLDGGGSSDPDGDPLTYGWSQLAGTAVALSDSSAAQPTFVAPSVPVGGETLSFQLVVSDGTVSSDPDAINVTVKNVNTVPVADAGDDQVVMEGSNVTLDGSASFDADGEGLVFSWSQVGGTPVVLSGSSDPNPSFATPLVGAGGDVLTLELVVADGSDVSPPDQVQIFVTNLNNPPVADAGAPQTIDEGSNVTLDGSGSSDPDGDPLGYSWTQLSGPVVVLSDPLTTAPTFVAPDVAATVDLVFALTVFDSNGAMSAAATTAVTVRDVNAPPSCSSARPSIGELWPPNHKMVEVRILGVADPEDPSVSIAITDVWQDEPTAGLGSGDTSPDAVLQGDAVLLRAEREGGANGRVYHISYTATDTSGAQCTGQVVVTVPHDRRRAAIDDGSLWDSTR